MSARPCLHIITIIILPRVDWPSQTGGYTSYDYGSALAEDRSLRPKYYEAKLIANFATTSPAYLTSRPQNIYASQGAFTGNERLKTTWTSDVEGKLTNFYTVRQTDISKDDTITYKLTVPTSIGNVTIPALGGELSLIGKDSKIHLVDYLAGSTQLVYSSAEIFTSIKVDGKDVIVLYGAKGELHETAIKTTASAKVVNGAGKIKTQAAASGVLAIQYTIDGQIVVDLGSALLYLVGMGIPSFFVTKLMLSRRPRECLSILACPSPGNRSICSLQHQKPYPRQGWLPHSWCDH